MFGGLEGLLEQYENGAISRRELLLTLSTLVAGAGGLAGATGRSGYASLEEGGESTRPQTPAFQGRTLNHTTLFVSDLDRSVEFYRGLFGIPVRSTQSNGVNLALGDQNQFLGLYTAPSSGPAIHHVCIGVDDFDPDEAVEKLEAYGVDSASVRMRGDTPELYFTDPDGLTMQIQDMQYCGGGGELGDRC